MRPTKNTDRRISYHSRFFVFSFKQEAEKLIKASESGSSSEPSSLRTEKSLQRQRDWEIDHARVRARRLREERLKEFEQEEKVCGCIVSTPIGVKYQISTLVNAWQGFSNNPQK